MGFDRTEPWCGTSLAMVIFRRQFTELNTQYWAAMPTEILAKKFAFDNGPNADLGTALSSSSDNLRRVGHNVQELLDGMVVSRSWARLHTLMLLSSALETYFRNATRAAYLSNPSRKPGFPIPVEGLTLLKQHVGVGFNSEDFTKGTWDKRLSNYESAFGAAPKVLKSSVGELDKMREMRNKIAHEFGLVNVKHPYGYLSRSSSVVSQRRLKGWLSLVDEVVRGVDCHLSTSFVGDFETLELLHLWRSDRLKLIEGTGVVLPSQLVPRPFMKFLAAATSRHVKGKDYWVGLNRYYYAN